MSERRLRPRVLSIGKAASERVSEKRAELHEWIAGRVTGSICTSDQYGATVYLGFAPLVSEQYTLIDDALAKTLPAKDDDDAVLLVDLTANPYDLLPDPLLASVGGLVGEWCTRGTERNSIILIPVLPSREASIFWPPISDLVESGRVSVVQNDGDLVGGVGAAAGAAPATAVQGYSARQAELAGSVESRIKRKMLRKVGHFAVPADRPQCARYFFDCSLALDDITHAIEEYVRRKIMPAHPGVVLLTHGPRSNWLSEAGMSAALALNAGWLDVSAPEAIQPAIAPDTVGVLIFDVVNSGTTMRSVVRQLREAGTPLASRGIAVLLDQEQESPVRADDIVFERFAPVDASKVDGSVCPQCGIGLSHTDPIVERKLTLRSFDAWDIFLEAAWVREPYGPTGLDLFDEAPDLGYAIENYGDYLAYKIEMIVESLRPSTDLVFVCPDEPQIKRLAERLGPRFQDRYVAVHIPRDSFEVVPQVNVVEDRTAWRKQLEHLGGKPVTVVVIDEMNASSTTASSLIRTLRAYGVNPTAYIPILDRDDMTEISRVPVKPLYSIPSPRRNPHDA